MPMPVVLRIRGFKFYFYANEGDEPPHKRGTPNRQRLNAPRFCAKESACLTGHDPL
jgi:hypothetical protein